MSVRVFRPIVLPILALFCLGATKGSNHYLPEHPGKPSVLVVATSNTPRYGLKPAEAAAFHASLGRFRDFMLAQPTLRQPTGVFIDGYVRADEGGPLVRGAPVRAYARILYYPYLLDEDEQRPFRMIASDWVVVASFNDATSGPTMYGSFYHEPTPAGRLGGFPVYRDDSGNEFVVMSATGRPLWVPLTREEYVRSCIADIEKEIAEEKAERARSRAELDPAALALLSPADRAEIERVLADDTAASLHQQRLKLHLDALARMSPEERKAQAQYGDPETGEPLGPQLAPLGKPGIGPPYVRTNPGWFDPSRPRSDIQLVVVKGWYGGMDPDHPGLNESGNAANLRLWETLHESDWKTLGTLLSLGGGRK